MTDKRTMPKVMPMPAPQRPPDLRPPEPPRRNNTEAVYAEEALRVAQRHLDQVDEINRLGVELDDWRRRALMAEAEIGRLVKREQDLTDALERQREKLMDERDSYRNRLNNLVSQFHSAGAIILKCIDAATETNSGGAQVNQTLLAQELERTTPDENRNEPQPGDDPLPSIVAAGPREP